MPAAAKTTADQLAKLEAAFRAIDPKSKATVPSKKALAKIAAWTGPLAADVATLWNWGLGPKVFAASALGMDGEAEWLTADDAARELAELREVPGFPKTFVPIAADGAGNFICFDLKTGHVTDWDHEVRAHRLMSKTLAAYLDPRRIRAERAVREVVAAAKEKEAEKAREKAAAKASKTGKGAKGAVAKGEAKGAAGAAAAASAPEKLPRGIRKAPSPHLTRYDAPGFAHGMEDSAMTLDRSIVAFASKSKTYLFDMKKGKEIALEHLGGSPALAFDAEGKRLVVGGGLYASLLDAATGKVTHQWEIDGAMLGGFTPDGAFVYLLDLSKGVAAYRVADLPKPAKESKKPKPFAVLTPTSASGYCKGVDIASDGTVVMIQYRYSDCEVFLWHPATKKALGSFVVPNGGRCVAIAPDGQRIAIGTDDGKILVVDRTGKLVKKIAKAHDSKGVYTLKFDPSGRVLVSSGEKVLKVWNAATGEPIGSIDGKSRNHAPRFEVSTVTRTHVLTSEPMMLFEFKF